MKTYSLFLISALALVWLNPAQAQKEERTVQIKIVENGKVKTDTSFTVKGPVDKEDIGNVSRMLNKEDVFVFKHEPGKRKFVYNFSYNDMPDDRMDSMFTHHSHFFRDSLADSMFRRFKEDSTFMFNDLADDHVFMRRMPDEFYRDMSSYHGYMRMRHPDRNTVEKEIIIEDDDQEAEPSDNQKIIIHKKGPGKKDVIINDDDDSRSVKTIRKKIDDDTEIIIIKKDSKKNKPDKHISRK